MVNLDSYHIEVSNGKLTIYPMKLKPISRHLMVDRNTKLLELDFKIGEEILVSRDGMMVCAITADGRLIT